VTDDERAADVLPEGAIVIRCGHMKIEELEQSAQYYFDTHGEQEYALSFFSFAGRNVNYIARKARCPNSFIRTSTAGRIRGAGYQLVRTGKRAGHYSIFWSYRPSEEEWRAFRRLFGRSIRNVAAIE
jgi:hypothetical protein